MCCGSAGSGSLGQTWNGGRQTCRRFTGITPCRECRSRIRQRGRLDSDAVSPETSAHPCGTLELQWRWSHPSWGNFCIIRWSCLRMWPGSGHFLQVRAVLKEGLSRKLTASTCRSEKCVLLPWLSRVIQVWKGLCKETFQSVINAKNSVGRWGGGAAPEVLACCFPFAWQRNLLSSPTLERKKKNVHVWTTPL